MKPFFQWSLTAVVSLGLSSVSGAQLPAAGQTDRPGRSGERPRNPLVRLLDRNADGEISAEELQAAPQALRTLDRNHDGQVTREEMRTAFREMARPGGNSRPAAGNGNRPGFPGGAEGRGSRPGSDTSETLERAGLEVGQALPELTILDADGQPFPLARLRGRYSVLVFGCLT